MNLKIAIGADHAGFPLKSVLLDHLKSHGYIVADLGTSSTDPCDYPDFAQAVAESVRSNDADLGIAICGSGVGASVAANKVPGIRAAVCHDTFSARQGREDDNLNVLCMGARVIGPGLAVVILDEFLKARFSGAQRHARRLSKIDSIEKKYAKS
jgi:ribose 5-phosphate isomerase B